MIMSAITLAASLFGSSAFSHAQPRFADYQKRAPIYQGCQQLAQMTVTDWAAAERERNVSCLDSGEISQPSYDGMLSGMSEDCTKAVVAKLGPAIDEEGDHDIALSWNELSDMFMVHYAPVFRQFCATQNPEWNIAAPPKQGE